MELKVAGAALGVFFPAAVGAFKVIFPVIFTVAVVALLHFYNRTWKNWDGVRRKLGKQGISGPPATFLYGNLPEMKKTQLQATAKWAPPKSASDIVAHEYTSTLFPYFDSWRKEYGALYRYSTGRRWHLYVNKVDLVKDLNLCANLDLGKPSYLSHRLAPLLGNGILRANGAAWARQRKLIAPQFFTDKVKGMVGLMLESAQPLLQKWEHRIDESEGKTAAEIEVDADLRGFSADVIARACFGSSYGKGKRIFQKLRELQKIISHGAGGYLFGHSSFRCLPSRRNQRMRKLEKEIESLIWETVQEREEECTKTTGKDLLQLIMEGAINDGSLGGCQESSKSFIVDNCKSIYFAGHESTAVAASWCLMLLALHPDWQARIREELSQVCHHGSIDATSLTNLKTVNMVIHEALRLYPPATFVSREALKETQVGDIVVPKGVCLWTLIPTLHRDSEIWGEDANEFKPERFANGIANVCKSPQAYLPFGAGPRLCLGKNFALIQLKIIVSLVVSKFKFSLSPKYEHSPSYRMIVEPAHGVRIIIQRV